MGDKTIKKHKEIVTKVQKVVFFFFLKGPGSGYDVVLDRDFHGGSKVLFLDLSDTYNNSLKCTLVLNSFMHLYHILSTVCNEKVKIPSTYGTINLCIYAKLCVCVCVKTSTHKNSNC